MYLHEYQAKKLLVKYNLIIPVGYCCKTLYEVNKSLDKIGNGPWIVKCQIHGGGRSKSGGVKIFRFKKDLLFFASKWFGNRLVTYQTDGYGQIVDYVLIEPVIDIIQEIYIGILIDRSINSIIFIASTEGGVEIETIANNNPNMIHKLIIDPFIGPQLYQGRKLAYKLNLFGSCANEFANIFVKLILLFIECDLELIEINPIVINKDNVFVCLDCKIVIDNNSSFRQSLLFRIQDLKQENKREVFALSYGLNYISLNGNIGCMVNGAGLAMGTMDMIYLYGGKPANFLDIGGGISENSVIKAFKIILSDKKVKIILVNVFGGIVRCDLVSNGIIKVMSEVFINIPIVVRLEGNNSKLGIKLLLNSGLNIINAINLSDAAKKVVFLIKENK